MSTQLSALNLDSSGQHPYEVNCIAIPEEIIANDLPTEPIELMPEFSANPHNTVEYNYNPDGNQNQFRISISAVQLINYQVTETIYGQLGQRECDIKSETRQLTRTLENMSQIPGDPRNFYMLTNDHPCWDMSSANLIFYISVNGNNQNPIVLYNQNMAPFFEGAKGLVSIQDVNRDNRPDIVISTNSGKHVFYMDESQLYTPNDPRKNGL